MIPIFILTRQYEEIEGEINSAILSTVRTGYFTLGPEVTKFEKKFASYTDTKFAIGVGSGTDALTLSLRALDLGPNDEIIVPANSYPSAFGLSMTGPKLRLIDVDTYGNMDIAQLPKVITKQTKAIIPVHLYGNPVDVPAIIKLLKSNKKWSNIAIIEDCAQAHGATIRGKHVGGFGSIGCFSFYPSKNLGAYGDAGMLVTNNASIAKKLIALRMYGETSRYHSMMISGVSRLDELQAAILTVKLKHLTRWIIKRRTITDRYIKELSGIGDLQFLFNSSKILESATHLFVIRTQKRDQLQSHLMKAGIQTAIHYPTPIHLTPSFTHLGYKKGSFPMTESLCNQILSLPLFPELTSDEQQKIIQHIKKFYRNK